MNVRKTNSLKSNLNTLINDGVVATELVSQLIAELRAAEANKERQVVLTGLARQLLNELDE